MSSFLSKIIVCPMLIGLTFEVGWRCAIFKHIALVF